MGQNQTQHQINPSTGNRFQQRWQENSNLSFFHPTLELGTHIQMKEKNKMDQKRKAVCVPTCGGQDKPL